MCVFIVQRWHLLFTLSVELSSVTNHLQILIWFVDVTLKTKEAKINLEVVFSYGFLRMNTPVLADQ